MDVLLSEDKIRSIIKEVESEPNKERKAEHLKRDDVYKDYSRKYVLRMLMNEFSAQTVAEMRTCTSINLTQRMIDEMASIYQRCPTRNFSDATDIQVEGIENLYEDCRVDVSMKRANQKYKLHEQCAIQIVPKNGCLTFRILSPHQYDVVPDPENPEDALAYVISTYDRLLLDSTVQNVVDIQGQGIGSENERSTLVKQQNIASELDYQDATRRYIIWTSTEIVKADANGSVMQRDPNPIGKLPFIDVASDKDFEFWVRRGSGVVDFSLDFSVVLSDTCNTNRLQSYAQPVIIAEALPQSVTVGPQNILFLPLDPTRPEVKPSFGFANPNPDMKASLDLQDRLLNYFMTSKGIDPKTINSSGAVNQYASGLDRLLAMIDRFEASQDDVDLFWDIEQKVYDLLKSWYTALNGTALLDPEYNFGVWPETAELNTVFTGPELLQTDKDKEDSIIRRLENSLVSRVDAMMELYGIDKEEAISRIAEIDADGLHPILTTSQRLT